MTFEKNVCIKDPNRVPPELNERITRHLGMFSGSPVRELTKQALSQVFGEPLISGALFVGVYNSFAEALDTSASDFDLLAVLPDSHFQNNGLPYFLVGMVLGRRTELKIIGETHFRTQLSRPYAEGDGIKKLETVHQFSRALPLWGGKRYEQWLHHFDRPRFSAELSAFYRRVLVNSYEDVMGLLTEGDLISAADNARYVVRAAFDGLLVSYGDTYPRPKWRIARMQKILAPNAMILDDFLRAEFSVAFGDKHLLTQRIYEMLRLASSVSITGINQNVMGDTVCQTKSNVSDYWLPALGSIVINVDDVIFLRTPGKHLWLSKTAAAIVGIAGLGVSDSVLACILCRVEPKYAARPDALSDDLTQLAINGGIFRVGRSAPSSFLRLKN